MKYKRLAIILFLIATLMPSQMVLAATKAKEAPPVAKTAVTPAPADASSESIKNLGKTVEKYIPEFISKRILWLVEQLEQFRLSTFSSRFIFYPVLFIFLFFSLRYIWRRFF